ncbi:MAG: DUF3348 domain-containing protein [Rhodoferax sp.]|uniref:DUF3348 domain-containing protein n=1 Tax=Rhodoferax sp. TaxID=50421 RepID=UPI00262E4088|nr:DUF3348 domain-containing protein [Rhodoferax sp.]MDD2880730.1 DUF3348 domain-containing protein [Rhodoferax sp.]
MTRVLTRTHLHSSNLIRVLADLTLVDAVEPGGAFAEKLGLWLSLHESIALHAAHNARAASPTALPVGATSVARVTIAEILARTRTSLENAITGCGSPNTSHTHIELPDPQPGEPLDTPTAYEPYRRYYQAHQRAIETSVRPLRAAARELLARTSPALKQLAALDAVFDEILSERESKLLATVPLLLRRRFEQLRQAQQQTQTDTQATEPPARRLHPPSWLVRFGHEMQTVLLAELDLRLQPALGLIEAFHHETNTPP